MKITIIADYRAPLYTIAAAGGFYVVLSQSEDRNACIMQALQTINRSVVMAERDFSEASTESERRLYRRIAGAWQKASATVESAKFQFVRE